MPDLPTDWGTLCLLDFLLGMRHGVDADHLAAINGLARLALRREPGSPQDGHRGPCRHPTSSHARCCGALFCLGHGAVVVGIATLVGLLSARWAPPAWMQAFDSWMSIGFLLALRIANLRAVLRTAPALASRLMGLTVAGASLLVAALGAARLLSPALDDWSDGRGQVFGGVVVLVIALSYLAARALARRAEAGSHVAPPASTPACGSVPASRQADPA